MTRLRALNESSSGDSEDDNEERETVEAQEERAFSLYKNALELRQQGHYKEAEQLLISLLNEDFLANVSSDDQSAGSDGLARPAAALKYACLKNLGNVLVLQSRDEDGLKCFIQAVELDESDVSMWHQIGSVALQIDDFRLASQAFQEGLRCNAHHWPCLDSLLPVLYALNDYLGCLLLVSRTLELDPEYPQALALRNQISKEDSNLLKNFKYFFPDENDVSEVSCTISEEESLSLISYALALQERLKVKNASQSAASSEAHHQTLNAALQLNTWENLGKTLLETYHSIVSSAGKSCLQLVQIGSLGCSKLPDIESQHKQNISDKTVENDASPSLIEVESEVMDVDSEQDGKGEDQTEEDATEASGLEQDEEAKAASAVVQQNSSALKRKRKRSSITLMDQWSKRRSGRRAGRKVEDREESNLASSFRSLLPLSLLPKDLEAELAKASKRRSLRDPVELLAWGDDSMDTVELCRLLQERDAKDERQREVGQHAKVNITQLILKENYFGTQNEISDVCALVEKHGSGTINIIQLLSEYNQQLAGKNSFTWPSGLVVVYTEVYECVRRHIPCPSPLDTVHCSHINILDLYTSLLYCEFTVDLWQQKNKSDPDILRENGLMLTEALGSVMLLSGLDSIFSSPSEQCRIILRVQWLKVHLFLLQEDSPSAINALHSVLESLDKVEVEDARQEKEIKEVSQSNAEDKSQEVTLSEGEGQRKVTVKDEHSESIVMPHVSMESEISKKSHDNAGSEIDSSVQGSSLTKVQASIEHIMSEADVEMLDATPQDNAAAEKVSKNLNESEIENDTFVESTSTDTRVTIGSDLKPNTANLSVDIKPVQSPHQTKEEEVDCIEGSNDIQALQDAECCMQPKESSPVAGILECRTSKLKEESTATKDISVVEETVNLSNVSHLQQSRENENITEGSNTKNINLDLNQILEKSGETVPIPPKSIKEEVDLPTDSSVVSVSKNQSPMITLSNCYMNREINKRTALKLLTSLTRQYQLSEVDDLYQNGQYEVLAGTLTECFKYCAQQADNENPEVDNLPDRATQMAMLLDSLWQLTKYSDCFYWTEACLHEAFNRYLNSTDTDNASQDQDDHQMWATTVERLLAGLNGCLKVAGLKLLEKLPQTCLTRLVQTLTSILCQQLEQSDCSVEMAIECTTPWVILHRIVFFEEQQHPTCQDNIPSHMRVLFTAHECMAKKARCCLNEGVLLNLILDVVVPQLQSTDLSAVQSVLIHEVEQAILCLYGHPKKPSERSKKRLMDHKVHQQLELTWERSLTLLRFYQPHELPTFDSNSKISPEEEPLFLRILPLVPNEMNPSRYISKMKAFLKGSADTLPEFECSSSESVWNIYYLLADYYYKTFKWEPAVKFYMLDVCLNPYRFDSWAGMALARATLLTVDLMSCNTLDNDVQLSRKASAQKCFHRALDLDPENTTLWIEFGSFAYAVHSFCSRLLKTETESLSMEMFTKIEEEKDKMLSLTEQCFKTAERLGQDEPWLPQYMLGKVAEKRGEGPLIFLQHYRAAAKLLYESSAEYPLSLNYDPPQHYAFEAHEVHYRIHASILKHLESMEGKHLTEEIEALYKKTLEEAARGPFMAVRVSSSQLSLLNSKRNSVDPVENTAKKFRLDEITVVNVVDGDRSQTKSDSSIKTSTENPKILKDIDMKNSADINMTQQSTNLELNETSGSNLQLIHGTEEGFGNKPEIALDNKSDQSLVKFNGHSGQPIPLENDGLTISKLPKTHTMDPNCDTIAANIGISKKIEEKPSCSPPKEPVSENRQITEHDYAAPYKDAVQKPTQLNVHQSRVCDSGDVDRYTVTDQEPMNFTAAENPDFLPETVTQVSHVNDSVVLKETVSTSIYCNENEDATNLVCKNYMSRLTRISESEVSGSKATWGSQSLTMKKELVPRELREQNKSSTKKIIFDDSSVIGCVNPSTNQMRCKPEEGPAVSSHNSPDHSSVESSECENNDGGDKNQSAKTSKKDYLKGTKEVVVLSNKSERENQFSSGRSLDHSDMVNQCITAMEECLVRYPRHYKSLYRLCHHYFRSKQHRNFKKCRLLLLGDYRVTQGNKTINGLFKSGSVNSMFNDVWRIPIEEIDRPGSFASHMSRCVHLLMELLRALRDHAFLLKLSVFLKREPEKKDKKYLRDSERSDLSKQALVMCLATMRECVNEIRTVDHTIELYRTVKDGLKELPLKEAAFKSLLSDAYKKLKGITKSSGDQQSFYEAAVDLCLNELNLRKATVDAKAKAQVQMQVHAQMQAQVQAQVQAQLQAQVHAQVQAQAQAQVQAQVKAQAQAQAQAMQMAANLLPSALAFNQMAPRFPVVANTPLVRAPLPNLPQMPVYRGRGRPPKAQQQLHEAMMSMAHIIGLANNALPGQSVIDSSKPKVIKHQQKQRHSQQQDTSPSLMAQSAAVSKRISGLPALSITALQGNKTTPSTTSATTTSSASITATPVRSGSPLSHTGVSGVNTVPSGQVGWAARPRPNVPRHMNPSMPGATDPRSSLPSTSVSRMPSVLRKDGPRHKTAQKVSAAPSSQRAFVQQSHGPFTPQLQSGAPLSNPTELLSRLPGLQVKQRPPPTSLSASHQEPRLQKMHMSNSESSKPSLSISKVSGSVSPSVQSSTGADKTETKKKNDPNFDVITLD